MLFKEITVEEFAEIRAREAAEDAYAEGERSGFSKGEKSGAAQEKREIAKNLKALKLTAEQITKATGLSVQEVEEL